jgi:hypothetical protein
MTRHTAGGKRLPRVDDLPGNIVTLMIVRALAEVYRDALRQPIPERLAAILRRIETGKNPHGHDAA